MIGRWVRKTCRVQESNVDQPLSPFAMRNQLPGLTKPTPGSAVWVARTDSAFWLPGTISQSSVMRLPGEGKLAPPDGVVMRYFILGLGGLLFFVTTQVHLVETSARLTRLAADEGFIRLAASLETVQRDDLKKLHESAADQFFKRAAILAHRSMRSAFAARPVAVPAAYQGTQARVTFVSQKDQQDAARLQWDQLQFEPP